jgi:hypothetical protein
VPLPNMMKMVNCVHGPFAMKDEQILNKLMVLFNYLT